MHHLADPVADVSLAPPAEPRAGRRLLATWSAVAIYLVAAIGVNLTPAWVFEPPDHPAIRSDGLGYHLWTRAVLDGTLSFCAYAEGAPPAAVPAPTEAGRCPNIYPPGLALLRFPVMAPFTAANGGELRSPAEDAVNQASGVVAGAVAVAAVVAVSRRLGARALHANGAALAVTFGTGLFHFATLDASFTHVYVAALVGVLAWLAVRRHPTARPSGVEPQHRSTARRFGALELVAWSVVPAMLVLLRQTSLVVIAVVLAGAAAFAVRELGPRRALGRCWPPAAAAAAGVTVAVVAQVAINSYAYGHLQLSSYGDLSFQFDELHQWDVALSWRKGAFTSYPIGLVALVAGVAGRRWWVLAVSMSATAALVAVYGSWFVWHLGGGFGHRGFVDIAPLWGVLLAVGLTTSPRPVRALLWVACVVTVTITLGLMAAYWRADVRFSGYTFDEWVRFGIGSRSFPRRLLSG